MFRVNRGQQEANKTGEVLVSLQLAILSPLHTKRLGHQLHHSHTQLLSAQVVKRSKRLCLMNKDWAKNNGMLSFLFQPEGFGRWWESRRMVQTWACPMSTVLATVAFKFLLLLDTSLLSQAGTAHYSQLLTLQHSTFLYCFTIIRSLSRFNFQSLRSYAKPSR